MATQIGQHPFDSALIIAVTTALIRAFDIIHLTMSRRSTSFLEMTAHQKWLNKFTDWIIMAPDVYQVESGWIKIHISQKLQQQPCRKLYRA